ncbi:MBL fold metallo-hydrolase [Patescibacteria group bacterium]|nr:MBL fold metallo-hydrolase [Patescibacteria group bacterium]MBU0963812.1 MBL fold metallo-hydrolase [Patescibacteria group bacterium]
MYITWLGQACFKIQGKEATIITDPFEPKIGLNMPHLKADVVTVSHDHYDHNNVKAISGQPFVIDTPGEYEIKNILIQGIPSWHDDKEGAERGANIIYIFVFEEIKIAHLGDLGTTLSQEQLEKIEGVDILLIPVGGVYTIDGKKAAEVISQIEPRIVIPMHYKIPKLKEKINNEDLFCKEMGIKNDNVEQRLKITKKDLPVEETKIIFLKP